MSIEEYRYSFGASYGHVDSPQRADNLLPREVGTTHISGLNRTAWYIDAQAYSISARNVIIGKHIEASFLNRHSPLLQYTTYEDRLILTPLDKDPDIPSLLHRKKVLRSK